MPIKKQKSRSEAAGLSYVWSGGVSACEVLGTALDVETLGIAVDAAALEVDVEFVGVVVAEYADALRHGGDDNLVDAVVGVAVGVVGVASKAYYGELAVVIAGGGVVGERPAVLGVHEDFNAVLVDAIGYGHGIDGHGASIDTEVLILGEGDDVALAVALHGEGGLSGVETGDIEVVATVAELDFIVDVPVVEVCVGVAVVSLHLHAVGNDDFGVELAGNIVFVIHEFGGEVAEFLYLVVVIPYGTYGVAVIRAVLQGEDFASAVLCAIGEVDVVGEVLDAQINGVTDNADCGVIDGVVVNGLVGLDGDVIARECTNDPCAEGGAAHDVLEEHAAVGAEGHLYGAALFYLVGQAVLVVVEDGHAGAGEFLDGGIGGSGSDDAVGVDGLAVGTLRLGEGECCSSEGCEKE